MAEFAFIMCIWFSLFFAVISIGYYYEKYPERSLAAVFCLFPIVFIAGVVFHYQYFSPQYGETDIKIGAVHETIMKAKIPEGYNIILVRHVASNTYRIYSDFGSIPNGAWIRQKRSGSGRFRQYEAPAVIQSAT